MRTCFSTDCPTPERCTAAGYCLLRQGMIDAACEVQELIGPGAAMDEFEREVERDRAAGRLP